MYKSAFHDNYCTRNVTFFYLFYHSANIRLKMDIHRIKSFFFDGIERILSFSLQKSLKRSIFA
jgi:hypothetical protein